MNESREIRTLRAMAWERAIGELNSMGHTYWNNDNFKNFYEAKEKFIKQVEDNGWHE